MVVCAQRGCQFMKFTCAIPCILASACFFEGWMGTAVSGLLMGWVPYKKALGKSGKNYAEPSA